MKKFLVNTENPNGIVVDMTAEEIAFREADVAQSETDRVAEENAKQAKAYLSLMDRVNKLLGVTPKSNKYLSFEFHDRILNEDV